MARRKKTSSPPKNATAQDVRIKHIGLWIAIVVAVITAGIPFALGKYIELNSPGPFDSGAYVYSAQHLLNGARLGIEEHPSAQPNTLLVNILGVKLFGFNETGPKIIQMALQLAAGVFMFYTLRRVFGSVAAVLGVTIAAVYLSSPMIAKFGNVKEQFMIAFMIYAACGFLLYELTAKRYWLVLSGFFALQPFYFKATGASVVIAIVFYLLAKAVFSRQGKTLCRELFLFLCGYAAGLMVPASLYIWQKQPEQIFQTFPPFVILAGLAAVGLLFIAVYGGSFLKKTGHLAPLKNVSKKTWLIGLILLCVALIASVLMIRIQTGYQEGDIASYLRSICFVGLFPKAYRYLTQPLYQLIMGNAYVTGGHAAITFSKLAPQILRYYKALCVPILAALTSLSIAIFMQVKTLIQNRQFSIFNFQFSIWMVAMWWMLDMTFVWVSPRSYEEYYLPLCGSAAMLSGYAVWIWTQKLTSAVNKMPWLTAGLAVFSTLGLLSIPTFIGQRYSPDTGMDYIKTRGARQRGFTPALKEIPFRQNAPWRAVGNYIRAHSAEDDTLYVWGWFPGIYVQAQRLAPVPNAFEGSMHVKSPAQLEKEIISLVETMRQRPPKFIVDSRKREFPNDRPPLELWPMAPAKMFGNDKPRLLSNDPRDSAAFDAFYKSVLEEKIEPNEALRYEAMKPFREFVMTGYKPIDRRDFGEHALFERK